MRSLGRAMLLSWGNMPPSRPKMRMFCGVIFAASTPIFLRSSKEILYTPFLSTESLYQLPVLRTDVWAPKDSEQHDSAMIHQIFFREIKGFSWVLAFGTHNYPTTKKRYKVV